MTLNETVDKAIEILKTRGWCTARYENSEGQVCMVGAVQLAAFGESFLGNTPITTEIYARLRAEIPGRMGIVAWNDYYANNAAAVIAMLESIKDQG